MTLALPISVEVPVAVDDVVGAATLDQVATGAAEQHVAGAPHVRTAQDRAVLGGRLSDDRVPGGSLGTVQRRHQGVETGDPVKACLVQHVTADEPGTADLGRHDVVAAELVVELPAGQRLDLVELVADADLQDVQRRDRQGQVHVLGLGFALADLPVVARGAGDLLDAGTADPDVVPALHVVVVVAALADEDVRAGHLGVVEEEQVAAVSLHEVRLVAALFPVVAAVTEGGVEALAEVDEVVVGSTEGLVGVGPTVGEVLAGATHQDVQAGSAVEGVVAGTALGHVVATEVGDDVAALAAECDVGSGATLDDVVAQAAPEGVVVVATADAVDAGRAVVDGLAVDARGVHAVERAVLDGAVGLPDQHSGLVALRRGVIGDRVAELGEALACAGQLVHLELAVRGRERVGLERVHGGVAHHHLGERVALELGAQVHPRRPGQVVQPVTVLEIGHLVLEHVVERGAEEPAERVGHLGEAADP